MDILAYITDIRIVIAVWDSSRNKCVDFLEHWYNTEGHKMGDIS